jgi:hypothetical protein
VKRVFDIFASMALAFKLSASDVEAFSIKIPPGPTENFPSITKLGKYFSVESDFCGKRKERAGSFYVAGWRSPFFVLGLSKPRAQRREAKTKVFMT